MTDNNTNKLTTDDCKKFVTLHTSCVNCNYFNCPYLTKDEQTTVYHLEEGQAGML